MKKREKERISWGSVLSPFVAAADEAFLIWANSNEAEAVSPNSEERSTQSGRRREERKREDGRDMTRDRDKHRNNERQGQQKIMLKASMEGIATG